MLLQSHLRELADGGGVVSEENFLRYRLQVVQKMADGPLKAAVVTAISRGADGQLIGFSNRSGVTVMGT